MEKVKVVGVNSDSIVFEGNIILSSDHMQSCCESHYLSFSDLTLEDFDGLEFDLSNEGFFKRIEDYGIELIPIQGHSVKVPGYGSNNGYYSSNLDLVLSNADRLLASFNISECQVITG